MRKFKRLLIVIIMFVFLLIGTGYATFNSNQTDFKVRFSGDAIVSDKNKVKAKVVNETNAILEVSGLTSKENKETITYIVQNTSRDLSADLSVNISNDNTEYFCVETKIEKTKLIKGEATKVIVSVELIKEPIYNAEKAKIGIQLVSKPVQPDDDPKPEQPGNTAQPETPPSKEPQTPSSTKPSNNDYGYFEKDETPKTGNFKFIDIFGR